MQSWETLSRRIILDHSKFLRIENHEVKLPDGTVISSWPWINTPEYVNILAQTQVGKFLCFRQTKYAVEGISLAPVGGYIEDGEDPLSAAKRELLEETGYEASEWISLGNYSVDANRGAGKAHLFLAKGAQSIGEADSGDLEEQQLLHLDISELERALWKGEFKVLGWTTIVALVLQYMKD